MNWGSESSCGTIVAKGAKMRSLFLIQRSMYTSNLILAFRFSDEISFFAVVTTRLCVIRIIKMIVDRKLIRNGMI
jgi:hypothetical protein